MRMLIVGAGATGGYFGGRLALAGRDVTFLVRPARSTILAHRGLRIRLHDGEELRLQPQLVSAEDFDGQFDLVLIAVKATGLAAAVKDLGPAIGPNTILLPILNGMAHLELLGDQFGPGRVLAGVVQIVGTLSPEGDVVQSTPLGRMIVGEPRGSHVSPELLTRVADVLGDAGFPFQISDDIEGAMWAKWVMISSAGAMTCLMRGTVGDIVAQPGGADLARRLLSESTAVAAGFGHPLSAPSFESAVARLTETGSDFTSSLYRDLVAGGPAEGEHLIADMASRARRVGVSTPLFDLATLHLRVHEHRRADG